MSEFNVTKDIIVPVIAWINEVLKDDIKSVIVDRPNHARPRSKTKRFNIKRPYITLNFTAGLTKQGFSNSIAHIEDTKWCMGESNTFTMGLKCYGDPGEDNRNFFEPAELLRRLRSSLDDETRRGELDKAGLSVRVANDILDISSELESGIESRYSLDMIMGIMISEEIDIGLIEQTEITGTYNGITEPTQTIPETLP